MAGQDSTYARIKTSRLKNFAATLPKNSALRELLLEENDEIDAAEFVVKIDNWLKLIAMESP